MAKKPNITITKGETKKSKSLKNVANKETPRPIIFKNIIQYEVQLQRTRQNIQKWRTAITAAENPQNPIRYNLLQIYRDAVLDAQIAACWMQRKNMIMGLEFEVVKDDVKDEELSKICNSKWFYDFMSLALDSVMWGFSLVQFDSLINDEFREISLVNRIYVRPELGIVTPSYTAITGNNFNEPPFSDWCIGVGDKYDLGLLMKLAPLYIWKKNALGAWADFQDKFGTPLVVGKTDDADDETSGEFEKMLANFSVNSWAMINHEDSIDLKESAKKDAFAVFDKMIDRCNSEIAKIILGQTGTMDEKAFVGAAEVHERILKSGMYADVRMIKNVLNKQLIPFLENLGFNFKGFKFDIEEEDELDMIEKSKIDLAFVNTGMYKMDPAYIKEKYGTEMIEVEQATTTNEPDPAVKKVADKLKNIYRLHV